MTWSQVGPAGAQKPVNADGQWWAIEGGDSGWTLASASDPTSEWARHGNPCGSHWPQPFALAFISQALGFLACIGDSAAGQEAKEILTTSDGGASWSVVASLAIDATEHSGDLPGHGQLIDFSMANAQDGWLVAEDLFRTRDGGRTWTPMHIISDGSHQLLSATLKEKTGAALAENSVTGNIDLLTTDDEGATWRPIASWPLGKT